MIYVGKAKSEAGPPSRWLKMISEYRFKLPTKDGYWYNNKFRFNLANNFWPEIKKHKHEQNAGRTSDKNAHNFAELGGKFVQINLSTTRSYPFSPFPLQENTIGSPCSARGALKHTNWKLFLEARPPGSQGSLGFWASALGFWVFWVLGFGFRVSG